MVKIMSMEHEYGLANERKTDPKTLALKLYSNDDYNLMESYNLFIPRKYLKNSSQIYVDCGHIEIALPECSDPKETVLYDEAASLMLKKIADKNKILVFKNNLDSQAHSYGCHENYHLSLESLAESLKIPSIIRTEEAYENCISKISPLLMPFLITRPIIAGSGYISNNRYLLSQRATVIETDYSKSTREHRPIINTKFEPFSKTGIRLHLISGDSNMSEFTNYLKLGSTALILTMIENSGPLPNIQVENPVQTLHEINKKNIKTKINGLKKISKTTSFKGITTISEEIPSTPLEIQKLYLSKAKEFFSDKKTLTPPWANDILNKWEFVLTALEENPNDLAQHIDWVIKKFLIITYLKSKRKKLYDEEIKKIDLLYHLISKTTGFRFYTDLLGLEKIVTEEEIEKAVHAPPNNTRAYGRTKILEALIAQRAKNITFSWDAITHNKNCIALPEPHENYTSLIPVYSQRL